MDRNITWSELTIRDILRADFFENTIAIYKDRDDLSPLTITAETYYDPDNGLYVPPQNTIHYTEIKNILETTIESKLIFIEGFAGCGKSTLINKIFYDICRANKADFSYEKYNYMLSKDRYNFNNGANTCLKSSNEINSLIINQLIDRITSLLKLYTSEEFLKIFNRFKYLVNSNYFISRFDKDRVIVKCLVLAPSIEERINDIRNNQYSEDKFKNTISHQISGFDLNLLLSTDFAWRLAQYLAMKDKTILYVCYDNLDAIDNLTVLQNFHQSIVVFITRVNKYFKEAYNDFKSLYEISYPQFYMIVTYRKITATRVSNQNTVREVINEEAGDPSHICQFDISTDYNYSNIVSAKVKYFAKLAKKNNVNLKITSDMRLLNKLNSLQIIRADYQAFWNHNFRGCADVMDDITTNQASAIKVIDKLITQQEDYKNDITHTNTQIYTGASSIFLRTIYNLFNDGHILNEQCLNLIPITQRGVYIDEHNRKHYTSLSRLILRFYYERGRCKINQLFKTFDGLYEPEQVAVALYLLLEKNNVWRRLLYYTDNALSNDNLRAKLIEQAIKYKTDDYYDDYTELSICPCGERYIGTISSSFEFYACRCDPNSKSLFDTNENVDIENTINMVLSAVKNCCERLQEFRELFMTHHKKTDIKFFLKQPFNTHTHSNRRQLYEERVIFNHIAFLEEYRHYAIKKQKNQEDKVNINKIIVDSINNYIKLYDTYISTCDSQRNEIANDLREQAGIIVNLEYHDFTTKISRKHK